MAESLVGRTALITGAGVRIGRAAALALADEGANIIVHYNTSRDEAEQLVKDVKHLNVNAWSIQADFNKPEEYQSLIERAIDTAGHLDILVNNASIFPVEKIDNLTFQGLMKNIEINSWVPFILSQEFKKRIGTGHIVNLEDSRVSGFDLSHVGYILSKHVLAAFTRMMALEYAPDIMVNAVRPGLILPPPDKDKSYLDRLVGSVPLKKHGEPEDIADAIVFLVRSNFITGEVIYVDGGRHLKEYANG